VLDPYEEAQRQLVDLEQRIRALLLPRKVIVAEYVAGLGE